MRLFAHLLMLLAFVPAVGAGFLAAHLGRTWDPFWRVPAWVPVAPPALVGANIFVGTLFDPTSHNLWPLELFLATALSVVLFGGLWLVRTLVEWVASRDRH